MYLSAQVATPHPCKAALSAEGRSMKRADYLTANVNNVRYMHAELNRASNSSCNIAVIVLLWVFFTNKTVKCHI